MVNDFSDPGTGMNTHKGSVALSRPIHECKMTFLPKIKV